MTVMEEVKISFGTVCVNWLTAYKTKKHPDVNFQLKLGVQQLTPKLTAKTQNILKEQSLSVCRKTIRATFKKILISSQQFDNDNEDTMVTVCGCPFVPQDRWEKSFHFLGNYLIQMRPRPCRPPARGPVRSELALTRWYLIWDTLTRHNSKYFSQ